MAIPCLCISQWFASAEKSDKIGAENERGSIWKEYVQFLEFLPFFCWSFLPAFCFCPGRARQIWKHLWFRRHSFRQNMQQRFWNKRGKRLKLKQMVFYMEKICRISMRQLKTTMFMNMYSKLIKWKAFFRNIREERSEWVVWRCTGRNPGGRSARCGRDILRILSGKTIRKVSGNQPINRKFFICEDELWNGWEKIRRSGWCSEWIRIFCMKSRRWLREWTREAVF